MPEIPCPAQGCNTTFRDDLAAEVLSQLIAIHAQSVHPSPAAPAQINAARMEKVKRPVISSAGSSENWDYFLARWQEYKQATRLTGQDVLTQLLECADEDLRKDLNRAFGTLLEETEEDALRNIKTLAVKPENILVARVNLHNLTQDHGETIRSFAARFKGQAKVCQFTKTKTCQCQIEVNIDYSDEIIRDTLIRGVCDEDIQLDILAQANQNLTLDETILKMEAKESGKRSAGILTNSSNVNATSAYKKSVKQKNITPQVKPGDDKTNAKFCTYCGKYGHSPNRKSRIKNCTAYNTQCTKCGMYHHFGSVCRNAGRGSASWGSVGSPNNRDMTSHDYASHDSSLNYYSQHDSPKSHDYSSHDSNINNCTNNTTDINITEGSHFFNGIIHDESFNESQSLI